MINSIIKNIDKSLIKYLDKSKKKYSLDIIDPILFNSIKEFSLRGGKRIRPLLVIISYMGYSKTNNIPADIYTASLSIELLHNFMLMHDDIIDNSDLRRGKPSMHKLLRRVNKNLSSNKLGTDLAIIAGDITYALAFGPLIDVKTTSSRKEKALYYFIKTTISTAMGEFIDTIHGQDSLANVKEKDAFLNYTLKTSQYTFAYPMILGAILAGANDSEIKKLSEFGILSGQSFQIQDDIIGIFDSEKNIGKSLLSDLAESKKTLLVCHAIENLAKTKKALFIKIFNKKKKTFKDLKTIRELMITAGSLQYCFNQIQKRTDRALKILDKIKMKKQQKQIIRNIIFKLFEHSNRLAYKYNLKVHIDIPH